MPVTEPGKIRNIAVAGHRGVGKTSLVEALLFQAGKTTRLGSIEQGTTVADWDDDEHKRQMSLSGAQLNLDWQDRKINLIDCPGDAGFQADTLAALRVVEGALVVVSAVMGVEVNTTARVEARRRVRALARRVREHARPRARRLLPRARGGPGAALRPLRRDPAADRRRARGLRHRRPAAHVRVHGSRPAGKRAARSRSRRSSRIRCRSTARSCSTRSSRRTRT